MMLAIQICYREAVKQFGQVYKNNFLKSSKCYIIRKRNYMMKLLRLMVKTKASTLLLLNIVKFMN